MPLVLLHLLLLVLRDETLELREHEEAVRTPPTWPPSLPSSAPRSTSSANPVVDQNPPRPPVDPFADGDRQGADGRGSGGVNGAAAGGAAAAGGGLRDMQQGEALLWRGCRGVPGHRPRVLPGLDLSHREDVRGGDPGRGEDPAAGRVARPPFLQSLDAIGLLEVSKFELQGPKEIDHVATKSSHALQECISLYRQINTCNGFYCDNFSPNKPYKPNMST